MFAVIPSSGHRRASAVRNFPAGYCRHGLHLPQLPNPAASPEPAADEPSKCTDGSTSAKSTPPVRKPPPFQLISKTLVFHESGNGREVARLDLGESRRVSAAVDDISGKEDEAFARKSNGPVFLDPGNGLGMERFNHGKRKCVSAAAIANVSKEKDEAFVGKPNWSAFLDVETGRGVQRLGLAKRRRVSAVRSFPAGCGKNVLHVQKVVLVEFNEEKDEPETMTDPSVEELMEEGAQIVVENNAVARRERVSAVRSFPQGCGKNVIHVHKLVPVESNEEKDKPEAMTDPSIEEFMEEEAQIVVEKKNVVARREHVSAVSFPRGCGKNAIHVHKLVPVESNKEKDEVETMTDLSIEEFVE